MDFPYFRKLMSVMLAVGLPLPLASKYIPRNETHYQFEASGIFFRMLAGCVGFGCWGVWER